MTVPIGYKQKENSHLSKAAEVPYLICFGDLSIKEVRDLGNSVDPPTGFSVGISDCVGPCLHGLWKTLLIDDLGSYDTAVNNEGIEWLTPNLKQLSHAEGLRLDRFYLFK